MTATARPFLETLREVRQGAALDELADHLQTLVTAVQETGKKGELIIKIKLKPAERGAGAYSLTDEIVVKAPQPDKHGTLFFATPDGNLSRKDPRQQELGLRDSAKPAAQPDTGDRSGHAPTAERA